MVIVYWCYKICNTKMQFCNKNAKIFLIFKSLQASKIELNKKIIFNFFEKKCEKYLQI